MHLNNHFQNQPNNIIYIISSGETQESEENIECCLMTIAAHYVDKPNNDVHHFQTTQKNVS